MRLLSLNTGGGRVHAPLIDYLRAVDADLFCLQEVVRTEGAEADWLDYRDGGLVLPQRARLFDEIAAVLPGHDAVFLPAERGLLHDAQGRTFVSEFGLATLVRRTLPVIGQVADFIHGAFEPGGWGGHPRARNAHALRLHDPVSGGALTVAHLHGLRDPAGKHDTPARLAQAQTLVRLVEGLRRTGEGLVVCGDFNVLPGSATFEVLAGLGLADLVTARGFTDTRTSLYAKPERYADYCLVSGEVAVRRFEVVAEPEVSDHRALLLEVE